MTNSLANCSRYFETNNIKKIYYFHIDHFEPTSLGNHRIVDDKIIDEFIGEMNKYDHSKKMSLFYRPTFTVRINKDEAGDKFSVDGDFVSFYWNKIRTSLWRSYLA